MSGLARVLCQSADGRRFCCEGEFSQAGGSSQLREENFREDVNVCVSLKGPKSAAPVLVCGWSQWARDEPGALKFVRLCSQQNPTT